MTEPMTAEVFQAQLVAAAVEYAKVGLPVFPVHGPRHVDECSCIKQQGCDSIAKHPIARLAPHGLLSASFDELTIRRWWKAEPRANIGIAVPSGMVVLDIDGPEGLDAIAAEGWSIPSTPTVSTPRGWHHWFKTTTDVRPGSDFMDHVDMRGPGGYVVAPPSMHKGGKLYDWEKVFVRAAVADAPPWIYELAQRPSRARQSEIGRHSLDMQAVLEGVPEGRRDQELFRAASKMRRMDLPYDMALEIIYIAASKCSPPFPQELAKAKVDSAYGRYQPTVVLEDVEGSATLLSQDNVRVELKGPNGPVEFVFRDMEKQGSSLDTEVSVRMLMPGTARDIYEQRLNILAQSSREAARREIETIFGGEKRDWARMINRATSEAKAMFMSQQRSKRVRDIAAPLHLEYLAHEFLLDERPTILFGPGGSLKTFVMMSVALAIARGEAWLGRPVQKRNVLIVDYETRESMTAYRLEHLAQALGLDEVPENVHHFDAKGIPFFDLVDPIRREIEAKNIGVLMLDHCGAACGTEPEKAESALRFYRACSKLSVPVIAIAHVTGDAAAHPELTKRPFGSVFWENGAGLTWLLQKEEQDEYSTTANIGLYQRKYNDTGRLRDFSVQFIFHDDGGYEVTTRALRESAVLLATHGARHVVWEALSQPLTLKQLSEAVGKSEDNCRKVMTANPHMFERLNPGIGGRGNEVLWQRSAAEAGRATTQSSFSSPSPSPFGAAKQSADYPESTSSPLRESGLSGLDSVKLNEDSENPDSNPDTYPDSTYGSSGYQQPDDLPF